MADSAFDIVILGAGPGGYVAAIRAAQLGFKVACVDENAQLGGTCLRVGCIPSKAMLESSHLFSQAQHGLSEHGIKTGKVSVDLAKMLKRKEGIVSRAHRRNRHAFQTSQNHGRTRTRKTDR